MRISDWSSDVCSSDLEYALIVPDRDMALEIDAGADTVSVPGGSVVFVPAGDTIVRATRAGRFVRLFTALSADLVAKRSEEHTSELPVTNAHLVCRLLLEKKKNTHNNTQQNHCQ